MTKDELIRHFADQSYASCREFAYKIILEHPEITDPERIGFAAVCMEYSRMDDVELSTSDALRLTARRRVKPVEELVQMLNDAGVNDANIDEILGRAGGDVDYSGCAADPEAERKIRSLNALADALTAENKDVVLLGRPTYFQYASYARLTLAFFCKSLSKEEQEILRNMRRWCDASEMDTDEGYPRLVFYIENIWQT